LEEKAAEAAAELAEEAQRLHKSLDVLHLGDKALRKLDSSVVSAEVDELKTRAEAAAEEFPTHDRLQNVLTVCLELHGAMAEFVLLEANRAKKREKERERRERLKAEGKLLSKTDRERLAKQEAMRAQMGLPVGGGTEDGAPRKKVVYGKRERKPKKTDGDEAAGAEAAPEADEAAAEAAAGSGAPTPEPAAAASPSPSAEAEGADEDWDDMDIDAKLDATKLAADEVSSGEEEEFKPSNSGLSSKLAALADDAEAARLAVRRAPPPPPPPPPPPTTTTTTFLPYVPYPSFFSFI
jgi:translation initiation factor 5B